MQPLWTLSLAILLALLAAFLVALLAAHGRTKLSPQAGLVTDWAAVPPLSLALWSGFGHFPLCSFLKSVDPRIFVAGKCALAAFPLLYVAARLAFSRLPGDWFDAARLLGLGEWETLWRLSIPASRKGLSAGLMLSILSALAIASREMKLCAVPAAAAGIAVIVVLSGLLSLARQMAPEPGRMPSPLNQ